MVASTAPDFSRAVALDDREVDPASEFHNYFKPSKQGQQTALAAEEILRSLRAFETYNSDAAPGLRLRTLTLATHRAQIRSKAPKIGGFQSVSLVRISR